MMLPTKTLPVQRTFFLLDHLFRKKLFYFGHGIVTLCYCELSELIDRYLKFSLFWISYFSSPTT